MNNKLLPYPFCGSNDLRQVLNNLLWKSIDGVNIDDYKTPIVGCYAPNGLFTYEHLSQWRYDFPYTHVREGRIPEPCNTNTDKELYPKVESAQSALIDELVDALKWYVANDVNGDPYNYSPDEENAFYLEGQRKALDAIFKATGKPYSFTGPINDECENCEL